MKVCSVDGCDRPVRAKGMCATHYRLDFMARQPACEVDGCDLRQDARGLCSGHYHRQKRHGDVMADVPLGSAWKLKRSPCGTAASYNRGCRCGECRQANADRKRREYQQRTVAGDPVREHVRGLLAGGMTRQEIADRAGMPYPTVTSVLNTEGRVFRATAEKLLRVGGGCVGCDGEPMPGGAIRCLTCFQAYVDDRKGRWRGKSAGKMFGDKPGRPGIPSVRTPRGVAA